MRGDVGGEFSCFGETIETPLRWCFKPGEVFRAGSGEPYVLCTGVLVGFLQDQIGRSGLEMPIEKSRDGKKVDGLGQWVVSSGP